MPLDTRDTSIISQVAAKIATDLAVHAKDTPIVDLLADFAVAYPVINEALIDSINAQIAAAAFPASTVVAAAPVNALPVAAQAAPVAATAPAAIPGVTDGDPAQAALWLDLFANPQNWHDNRNDPGRPARAPEFRHKTAMDAAGKYKLGLYINDKKNPSWVAARVAAF